VVAAPPWSLTLKTWCFPVTGCVGYRGYFDEAQAQAYAAQLRAQGLEASVYGVPAYSTLGWMNWAGGDPLLSTFITYPEGELARMVFHELAHQALFVQDDTPFNESFATAVERIGGAQWLELHGSTQALAEFDALTTRRAQFRALTRATRRQLANLYADQVAILTLNTAQAAMKEKIMQDFRAQYAELKASWSASSQPGTPQFGGYDAWVANANNAAFGAQAAYDVWVPQFEALFQQEARTSRGIQTWQQFYATVKRLAELPLGERTLALERIELPSHAVTNP
jgi:predicted aminopeptidase